MDYNAIAAWAGLATAVATAATVVVTAIISTRESKRHRSSMAVELILRLNDDFAQERMYANRRKVAEAIVSKNEFVGAENEIEEILDFFEGVGFLVRNGVLDRELVWNFFFFYLARFWMFAGTYVSKDVKDHKDHTLWEEARKLYDILLAIEKEHRGKKFHRLTPKEAEDFFHHEKVLP